MLIGRPLCLDWLSFQWSCLIRSRDESHMDISIQIQCLRRVRDIWLLTVVHVAMKTSLNAKCDDHSRLSVKPLFYRG